MNDPIVAEVRKVREEYARQFNFDLHAMCEDLRRKQKLSGGPVVSFPKKPVRTLAIGGTAKRKVPVTNGTAVSGART
ncbi:MAG: hypothetical protein WCJ35_14055 [Planctomycetota bacterium]